MKIRDHIPGWNYCEYLFLRAVCAFVNSFPIEISTQIARATGGLLFFLLPKRRKATLANIDLAFGNTLSAAEKRKLAQESFRNLATSLMEFFRIPKILEGSSERVKFSGTEHLDQAFARGHGVLLVISHLGSWELLAFLGYLRGYPCSVVGRPMKNPYVYKWVWSLRNQIALNHIDKRSSIKPILSALKANKLVAILIDQWAGSDGLWLDFFGTPTSTTSIPARLAKRMQSALIPAYCLRTSPGHYEIRIKPEIPLAGDEDWEKETTLILNRKLEEQIRAMPGQWAWTHKRWKSWKKYNGSAAPVTP